MGDNEGGAEMVGLVVQLVSLTQDLVEAKLRLEAVSKAGWLELAEARKSTGSRSVSRLQLPSTEGEREVEAVRRVVRAECKQDNGVRCVERKHSDQFLQCGAISVSQHPNQGTITSMSKRTMRTIARRILIKGE